MSKWFEKVAKGNNLNMKVDGLFYIGNIITI